MTSNVKSVGSLTGEGDSDSDGSATASTQIVERGSKEAISINSGNELGGKNADDIESSSSSSGIDLTRNFLYVQFEKREKDGKVYYVADSTDNDARHQFLTRFRTGQPFVVKFDRSVQKYKPVFIEENFCFEEHLNKITSEAELRGELVTGWITIEEGQQELLDRELTDLLLKKKGDRWVLDIEDVVSAEEYIQGVIELDKAFVYEGNILHQPEEVRRQKARVAYDKRKLEILERIHLENLARAEGEEVLRRRKPIVEVSPESTRSKKERKLGGDLHVRPETRKKRKVKQQKASSVKSSTWESSAQKNYEDTSSFANLGLKKRKTKSPVKTLTALPISANLRRLTAESRKSGSEIEVLRREVVRLSEIVNDREDVYADLRRNRQVIGNIQREVTRIKETVNKLVKTIGI